MKRLFAVVTVLVMGIAFSSAQEATKGEKKADTGAKKDLPVDSAFLSKAAEANHSEVEVSKVVEMKTSSPAVKEYAAMLVKDHTENLDKLGKLFTDKKTGVVAGTDAETKDTVSRLSKLAGNDLDKTYLDWAVKTHKEAVDLYENQVKNGKDAKISDYAKESLTAIRHHLEKAESLTKVYASK